MSTKSYSLADGTTVTVNATDNGIKFNEGIYLQDAFKVWNVDFTTPRFVQSSKTLPQVLDDLAI